MNQTPVSSSNETMAKQKIVLEFNLVEQSGGPQNPNFIISAHANGVTQTGSGNSKKKAKQDAARLLMKKLASQGAKRNSSEPSVASSSGSQGTTAQADSIGALEYYCCEQKLPPPVFTEVSEEGPPDDRRFTYCCAVKTSSICATQSTKTEAKQLAAQKMLRELMNMLPDSEEEGSSSDPDPKDIFNGADPELMAKYAELSKYTKRKPKSLTRKVSTYGHTLMRHCQEAGLSPKAFYREWTGGDVFAFNRYIGRLGLSVKLFLRYLSDELIACALSISSDPEMCLLGMAKDVDGAVEAALERAVELFRDMLGCN